MNENMNRNTDNWTERFKGIEAVCCRPQKTTKGDNPAGSRDAPDVPSAGCEPPPTHVAGGRAPWSSPDDIPLSTVVAAKARLNLTSLNRSTFAQALFPYKPEYGTQGQWCRMVGSWVAGDIQSDPWLRQRMALLKYVRGKKGYCQQEIEVLIRHYLYKGMIG